MTAIRQIAPQFFTTGMAATLEYYSHKLGFECVGTWGDPPIYAIVARDGSAPPATSPVTTRQLVSRAIIASASPAARRAPRECRRTHHETSNEGQSRRSPRRHDS